MTTRKKKLNLNNSKQLGVIIVKQRKGKVAK